MKIIWVSKYKNKNFWQRADFISNCLGTAGDNVLLITIPRTYRSLNRIKDHYTRTRLLEARTRIWVEHNTRFTSFDGNKYKGDLR